MKKEYILPGKLKEKSLSIKNKYRGRAVFLINAIISLSILSFNQSCTNQMKAPQFKEPPLAVVKAIEEKFKGALPYQVRIDSLLQHLQGFGILPNDILWGQSTCVDDITNTKNKLIHAEIKGPFNFGGLAGMPFTGITGLSAFAHHVPEEGTALLFLGPHIGYNEQDGWGKIVRHGQHHASSCCGALFAALQKLQKGELKVEAPAEEDYQEEVIEQLAFLHRDEILSAKDPLVALTIITYHESQKQIAAYVSKVKTPDFKYVVIVGGIIINTDFEFPDYLWIEGVSILDIKNNKWLEGEKFHQ